jgi:hypoxanthine phosphoribosyltransferase
VIALFGEAEIGEMVATLAARIAADYARKPLILVGVLKGALYFTVDLARALAEMPGGPSEILVDYVCAASYGNATESSGEVRLLMDLTLPIEGQNVLIVEDIADNGLTLERLRTLLQGRRPASLRIAVLLDKPARRRVEVPLDYVGATVPDAFVVGYGLDYQERYRNLPYVARLDPHSIS